MSDDEDSLPASARMMFSRLKTTCCLSDLELREYWDCFSYFPLDAGKKLTITSLRAYLQESLYKGVDISEEKVGEALGYFTGKKTSKFIDFEGFVTGIRKINSDESLVKQSIMSSMESICEGGIGAGLDRHKGEIPKLIELLDPSISQLTEPELEEFCRAISADTN